MSTGSIETNLAQFQSALARYMVLSAKMPDELLDKKGRDLGIKLYEGFAARRWGGGKARKIAFSELAARTASGRGTKVRSRLLGDYNQARKSLNAERRSLGQRASSRNFRGTLDQWSALKAQSKSAKEARANLWRRVVGIEVEKRQAGIGVLAASFLWFRRRSSQARGTYFVRNKTGTPLGYVERDENSFRIVGLTDGLETVSTRYGIVATAISDVTADMQVYIQRKEREIFGASFGGAK